MSGGCLNVCIIHPLYQSRYGKQCPIKSTSSTLSNAKPHPTRRELQRGATSIPVVAGEVGRNIKLQVLITGVR
jgi:hypothetical protein